jgi:DNA-binding NtrC family response regulator
VDATSVATLSVHSDKVFVRRFHITVVEGRDRGLATTSDDDELTVGTGAGATLRLSDRSVSRQHCVFRVCERGLELRDLGSKNGTVVGDVEVVRGRIGSGAQVRVGNTTLEITILADMITQPLAKVDRFEGLLGGSTAMRRMYPLLERCAQGDATVLIHGETGTGKELVAEAIHCGSARRDGPFVVVDCSALTPALAESELFGHIRGAFTGADSTRIGAFELASGGTLFLDEIGELPLRLQPLLLRALEKRTIRPVGTNTYREVDVRVIAASHRDLRVEVNAKRFRSDLFYRLNVLRVHVPPLRDRAGDIELLAKHFWRVYRPRGRMPDGLLDELVSQPWPGNVRELRNAIERSCIVGWQASEADARLSHAQAKAQALHEWERLWVTRLLAEHGGNLTHAARAARIGRSHLRRLAQQYQIARTPVSIDDDEPG